MLGPRVLGPHAQPRLASPASHPTLHAGPSLPPRRPLLLSEVRLRQGWPIAPDCAERAPPPPRGPAPRPRPQPRSDRLSTDHPWSPASGPLSHVGVRLALPEEARAVDGARGLAELGVGVSCGRGSAKRGSFLHSG